VFPITGPLDVTIYLSPFLRYDELQEKKRATYRAEECAPNLTKLSFEFSGSVKIAKYGIKGLSY